MPGRFLLVVLLVAALAPPALAADAQQKAANAFRGADRNRDGVLSLAEFQAMQGSGATRGKVDRSASRFAALDPDRDGVVSAGEFTAGAAIQDMKRENRAKRMIEKHQSR